MGRTMTPEVAARYGAAFGSFIRDRAPGGGGGHYVLVGRDSRTSGSLLSDAVAAGVRAAGLDVRLTGIAPTPTHLLAVKDDQLALGGLIVTASHNPVEWNGLKLAAADGRFVTPDDGLAIQSLYEAGPSLADWDSLGAGGEVENVAAHHVERILDLDLVDADAIRAWAPVVALDCVHGAGAVVVPELLTRLGCRVEGIGLDPDGRFPRNPEPTPENLGELGDRVRTAGAVVGLAVDPDSDRLALVDETGAPIGEDWTLAFATEYVLERRPGPVVTNLSSSQSIEDVARAADVPFFRSAVGEARVAAMMSERNAVIGGEGNGGVMLPDLNLTRDAPLAAALVLSHLATHRTGPGELLRGRRRYTMVKRKTAQPPGGAARAYEALRDEASEGATFDDTDGLRITWPEAGEWLHVRPSGTEPILRIISEAPETDRAVELADRAEAHVAALTGD
ncbi:MAG: phosphoglucosamine mutase [marine benthic group bacterium]|nr:phosphoglucosamine mutase [Gemmatimonadota bacterium]